MVTLRVRHLDADVVERSVGEVLSGSGRAPAAARLVLPTRTPATRGRRTRTLALRRANRTCRPSATMGRLQTWIDRLSFQRPSTDFELRSCSMRYSALEDRVEDTGELARPRPASPSGAVVLPVIRATSSTDRSATNRSATTSRCAGQETHRAEELWIDRLVVRGAAPSLAGRCGPGRPRRDRRGVVDDPVPAIVNTHRPAPRPRRREAGERRATWRNTSPSSVGLGRPPPSQIAEDRRRELLVHVARIHRCALRQDSNLRAGDQKSAALSS